MPAYLVSYLRLLGFSVCTLALAVCTRFAPAHAAAPVPQPRIAYPPPPAEMAAVPGVLTDADMIAELEARLAAISCKIVNLSKALDVLGALPDHADLFVPVEMADLDEPAAIANFDNPGLGIPASVPPASPSLGLTGEAGYHMPSHNIRLNGDLGEDEAMTALCVELFALAGPARVVAPIRAW